jgi:hypothetical protein
MKPSVISFNGKTPSEQEREQLTPNSVDKTPFSSVKRKRRLIVSFLFLLSGIVALIFSLFLFWSRTVFHYPRGRAFAIGLFGFSFFLFFQGAKSFCSFYSMSKGSYSRESPQVQVLHKYVKCLLDTNYFHTGTLNIGNFYARLQRMLPVSQRVDYKTFETYLTDFHSKMMMIVKDDAKALNLMGDGFKVSSANTSITSNETVSQCIEKLTMEVNLYVEFTQFVPSIWKDKLKQNRVSHVKLIFNMTLVQLDEYWFVYNPLPDYKINNQVVH